MICKWCGVEIIRRTHRDKWVEEYSKYECRNRVTEAWSAGKWLTCEPNNFHKPIGYHEPLIETLDEMLASLREIELDLR